MCDAPPPPPPSALLKALLLLFIARLFKLFFPITPGLTLRMSPGGVLYTLQKVVIGQLLREAFLGGGYTSVKAHRHIKLSEFLIFGF